MEIYSLKKLALRHGETSVDLRSFLDLSNFNAMEANNLFFIKPLLFFMKRNRGPNEKVGRNGGLVPMHAKFYSILTRIRVLFLSRHWSHT